MKLKTVLRVAIAALVLSSAASSSPAPADAALNSVPISTGTNGAFSLATISAVGGGCHTCETVDFELGVYTNDYGQACDLVGPPPTPPLYCAACAKGHCSGEQYSEDDCHELGEECRPQLAEEIDNLKLAVQRSDIKTLSDAVVASPKHFSIDAASSELIVRDCSGKVLQRWAISARMSDSLKATTALGRTSAMRTIDFRRQGH